MAWETTKTQHLLKNSESGVYYARIKQAGKQVWLSLRTNVYSVAKAKLPRKINELRNAPETNPGLEKGKPSVESLIAEYIAAVKRATDIKSSTVYYREQLIVAIRKTWPELARTASKNISEKDCARWAKRF
jgi:hypothetical protein